MTIYQINNFIANINNVEDPSEFFSYVEAMIDEIICETKHTLVSGGYSNEDSVWVAINLANGQWNAIVDSAVMQCAELNENVHEKVQCMLLKDLVQYKLERIYFPLQNDCDHMISHIDLEDRVIKVCDIGFSHLDGDERDMSIIACLHNMLAWLEKFTGLELDTEENATSGQNPIKYAIWQVLNR